MDHSKSWLVLVPCNKLVLKKEYMIKTKNGIYTGTYYYMLGVNDLIHDMLGYVRSWSAYIYRF